VCVCVCVCVRTCVRVCDECSSDGSTLAPDNNSRTTDFSAQTLLPVSPNVVAPLIRVGANEVAQKSISVSKTAELLICIQDHAMTLDTVWHERPLLSEIAGLVTLKQRQVALRGNRGKDHGVRKRSKRRASEHSEDCKECEDSKVSGDSRKSASRRGNPAKH
jgi:hypothetical protein